MKLSGKLFPQLFVTYRKRHRKSTQSSCETERNTEKTAHSKTGTLTLISVSVEVVNSCYSSERANITGCVADVDRMN